MDLQDLLGRLFYNANFLLVLMVIALGLLLNALYLSKRQGSSRRKEK